jgi:glucose-6-phosphate isomerase
MGDVTGVNPFDQPGVEEGKIYIRETLVRNKESNQLASENEVHRLRRHQEN